MEQVKLSNLVISPADLARLRREVISLSDFFVNAQGRQTGTAIQPPKLTRALNQLAQENQINLLEAADRDKLEKALGDLHESAPTLHISFASEPSPKALEKLITWIRSNISPNALIQVGLQPSIAAGAFLRTPNKMFDMSLRASLKKSEPMLVKLIAGAIDGR